MTDDDKIPNITLALEGVNAAYCEVEEVEFGHTSGVAIDVEVDWEIGGDSGSATVSTNFDLDDVEYEVRTAISAITMKLDLADALQAVADGLFNSDDAELRHMIGAPPWASTDAWEGPDAEALDQKIDAYADRLVSQTETLLAAALVSARKKLRAEADEAVETVKSNLARNQERVERAGKKGDHAR